MEKVPDGTSTDNPSTDLTLEDLENVLDKLDPDTGDKNLNVKVDEAVDGSFDLNIQEGVLEKLLNEGFDSLSLIMKDLIIVFDSVAIYSIVSQVGEGVTLRLAIPDVESYPSSLQGILGDRLALTFTLEDATGTRVEVFGTGQVEILYPYESAREENQEQLEILYIDSEGKTSFMESEYQEGKGMLFYTDHFSTYAVVETVHSIHFPDIQGHWGEDELEYIVAVGLSNGTSETTFSPDISMTRGMFVTMLGRLAEVGIDDYVTSNFSDVDTNQYYAPYVAWAEEEGIVLGIGDGCFAPESEITREQMAVILYRAQETLGLELPTNNIETIFYDEDEISSWATLAVSAMVQGEILLGSDGYLTPQDIATRAQASAVLRRLLYLL